METYIHETAQYPFSSQGGYRLLPILIGICTILVTAGCTQNNSCPKGSFEFDSGIMLSACQMVHTNCFTVPGSSAWFITKDDITCYFP